MAHQQCFLGTPNEIRTALQDLSRNAKRLDLAVAFIGDEARDLFADFNGKVRLICWFSTPNTNPRAVAQLQKWKNWEVRQRDAMHSKVYLAPGRAAIIGSANISGQALSESEHSGQDEAAILETRKAVLKEIGAWFERLWTEPDTREISDEDMKQAIRRWDEVQKNKKYSPSRKAKRTAVPSAPVRLPKPLLPYADAARQIPLPGDIKPWHDPIRKIKLETLSRKDVDTIISTLANWSGHKGAYNNFRAQPLPTIRKGMSLLFDEGHDIGTRLSRVFAENLLPGLQMPSISMLLYFRFPDRYPPYNYRTKEFLKHFKLAKAGVSAASPEAYVKWLGYARQLAQHLNLPKTGHVDRMVIEWYEQRKR